MISGSASQKICLFIALLAISCEGNAWIAFGFKSGMSRFDVSRHLSDNESFVITNGEQQTRAGPEDNRSKYVMTYCATPQRLYLMRYGLDDSLEAFIETKNKFEKRYGQPTPLYAEPDYRDPDTWENADIAFIWDLNETETILLRHGGNETRAEFQDLSVCE